MPPRLPEHEANFSFELTGDRGAALVTRHETCLQDARSETAFEAYTKRHYKSWVEFARHKEYGNDVRPFLVTGIDMTRDFAMVAYSNGGHHFESSDTIAIPMFASSPLQGTWRAKHQVHITDGPHQRSATEKPNQCVFIRYYTMRWRKWLPMFPKVIRAGAEPHDPGPGDNRRDTLPELAVQRDTEHESGDQDFRRQQVPTTDDTDSEEYDSWDAIADYIFQVIPFFVPPPGYSTLSMEELQRYICVDAPPRPGGCSCGKLSTDIGFQNLISGQGESSGDILSLLTTKRPRIVVDERGGQPTSCVNSHNLIPFQWAESFAEKT